MSASHRRDRDLTELLSEVYDADRQANNPRTREFLEAGEQLLHRDLTRDAGQPLDARGRPPFEEVLAWLSRRRVVTEAARRWKPRKNTRDAAPTEAAFRYRWRTQVGYLRDLVIWALSPRMERPDEIEYADRAIDAVHRGEQQLPAAIDVITSREVEALKLDKSFRLQMVFQATLAHDTHVADALHRIDKANVDAWTEFTRRSFQKLGLELRDDMDFALLGCALHSAGEGVMFRELLPSSANRTIPSPTQLLNFIAKALIVASVELGNGETLDETIDRIVEQRRSKRGDTAGQST
jgi:hypothetical protein